MSTIEALAATSEEFAVAFRSALLMVLDEAFENVHGYMLDPGDSFFETLPSISAEEASTPVSSQGATLSAQVNHTRFYIDVLLEFVRTGEQKESDWDGSWQVGAVTDKEWQELIERLRNSYHELRSLADNFSQWDANTIGGSFAVVGHCMYHLGEIRTGISVIRDRRSA